MKKTCDAGPDWIYKVRPPLIEQFVNRETTTRQDLKILEEICDDHASFEYYLTLKIAAVEASPKTAAESIADDQNDPIPFPAGKI